jgi:GMP synthase (glutamine-hydrolysing)
MKTAIALRHVAFEDLGSFASCLTARGLTISYLEAATDNLTSIVEADLLVVLGGPIGVYETESYPFLTTELDLIQQRLILKRPTLGLCLGSQLIAQAMNGQVYPGHGKEIGWKKLSLSTAGQQSPLRHLNDVPVLHWHGDTFILPPSATLLASTDLYPHQAFAIGDHALALQFHPEVTATGLEHWYVGHACEIANTVDLQLPELRAESAAHAPALAAAGKAMLEDWLSKQGL